jgi:16S rRNA (guanine527-N7)-methyltransferase
MDEALKTKLKSYQALLDKWQPKINLISSNTLNNAWERHFEDSLQMADLIPNNIKTLFDLGSGGGFPGLVLAMARPEISVNLVESDQKKCAFLKTVSRETQTAAKIHNCRIEDVSHEIIPDIITARALASLPQLFEYCQFWIKANPNLVLIFPKGMKADEELASLSENWRYELCTYDSQTDERAKILVFSSVFSKA